MIKEELLKKYGAVYKQLEKGQLLFYEGDTPVFYYQIVDGTIKMNNYNEEGQETIQGIFTANQSFGEPAILGDFPFPANAEALDNSTLICLEKHQFYQLLQEQPEISIELLQILSRRLRFKAILSKEVKGFAAEHRIMTLLEYLKKESGTKGAYCVSMTRQTIANLTGLRVETVIRTIKSLAGQERLVLKARKIYLEE